MQNVAFVNGRIISMDPAIGEPEVLILEDGRIKAAGEKALLKAFPEAAVRDLQGMTLLPGFIDAHNHLSIAALHPLYADLSQTSSLEDIGAALMEQATACPDAGWVRGVGWSELAFPFPLTRTELDAMGIDRPILVTNFSYHHCVVNSRGLEELGIGRNTPDPEGGEIVRGPDGEPTGVLVERAEIEAHVRALAHYSEPARWAGLIEERARFLLRHGITCVHDAGCGPAAEAVYRELARSGRLPISVLAMPQPDGWLENDFPDRLEGPPTGEGDEIFRVGPMKFFADGGVNCAIDLHVEGQRVTVGHRFPNLSLGVSRAVERGFQVAVHAMGNVGMESTLEAFDKAAGRGKGRQQRFRIEHCTLATPAQIRRFASLDGVGVIQPGFVELYVRARDLGLLVEFDEAEWMPFRTLLEENVTLAASSDDPCGPLAPLRTSCYGTTRSANAGVPLGPKQGIDYDAWLRAYTMGAAYAGGQENERGSLSPGKRADLVVVDGKLGPEGEAGVAETWVGGESVYRRGAPPP